MNLQEISEALKDFWISVDDQMPPEYERVLFTDGKDYTIVGEMFMLNGDEPYWYGVGEPRCLNVKYWMPLPSIPKKGE